MHEAGRAALKEKRANLDSNMRVHATNREAHVDIVKTKGANELNKVANAIAKRLDGWEDKYEQLEETLEDAAISRAQHLEAKVQKAKEVSKKVWKAEMRFKCETRRSGEASEISAAVAAKRREALDEIAKGAKVWQKVEAAAAKLQAETVAKERKQLVEAEKAAEKHAEALREVMRKAARESIKVEEAQAKVVLATAEASQELAAKITQRMESTEANREKSLQQTAATAHKESAKVEAAAARLATQAEMKACAIMSDMEQKKIARGANIMAGRAPARRPSRLRPRRPSSLEAEAVRADLGRYGSEGGARGAHMEAVVAKAGKESSKVKAARDSEERQRSRPSRSRSTCRPRTAAGSRRSTPKSRRQGGEREGGGSESEAGG